jgi:putative FmdB family regulatory protein
VPIYEYRCTACGKRFEELVRADAGSPQCENCGSEDVERLLSAFATEWKPSIVNWHRVV